MNAVAWHAACTTLPARAASDIGRAKRDTSCWNDGDKAMATHLVKVLYEGDIGKALKNAEAGLTSGGAVIYEIQGVPADVTFDQVVQAMQKVRGKPQHKDHEVKWADLVA